MNDKKKVGCGFVLCFGWEESTVGFESPGESFLALVSCGFEEACRIQQRIVWPLQILHKTLVEGNVALILQRNENRVLSSLSL